MISQRSGRAGLDLPWPLPRFDIQEPCVVKPFYLTAVESCRQIVVCAVKDTHHPVAPTVRCAPSHLGWLNIHGPALSLDEISWSSAMQTEKPPSLLYRYFFFGWLFRDVVRGNLFERAAAWRHNQAQSHWLPTYLKRWTVLSFLFFAAGGLCTLLFEGHWIGISFYVLLSVAIPVCSVIVVAWLGLRLMPGP